LELRRCVWLRQQLQLRKIKIWIDYPLLPSFFFARMRVYVLCCACVWCVVHACVVCACVCVFQLRSVVFRGHEEQQYLKNSSVPIAIPFLASGLQSIYANL
jgi:hypothetical protein